MRSMVEGVRRFPAKCTSSWRKLSAPSGSLRSRPHPHGGKELVLAQSEFGAGIALEPQPKFRADLNGIAHRALAAAAPLALAVLRQ